MGVRARELLLLTVGDAIVLWGSLWLALASRHLAPPAGDVFLTHVGPFSVVAAVWVGIFWLFGLYDKHTTALLREMLHRLTGALALNALVAVMLFFLLPTALAPKTILLLYTALVGLGMAAWRLVVVRWGWGWKRSRMVIVGQGGSVQRLVAEIAANPFRYPFTIEAIVDPNNARTALASLAGKRIDWMVLDTADPKVRAQLSPLLVWAMEREVLPLSLSGLYEHIFDAVPIEGDPQLIIERLLMRRGQWYLPVKRAIDVLLAIVALGLLALLLPFVWIAHRLEGVPGSIWYIHDRIGRGMRPFRAVKFRTLQRVDPVGRLLDEAPNPPTKVGKVLRALSLDELPQAINVLRGEMSFIGPRADAIGVAQRLSEQLPLYPFRYLVPPGITGWAQTHQRYPEGKQSPQNVAESAERLSYDLYYVAHFGWWVDTVILLRTIRTILERVVRLVREWLPSR